MAYRGFIYSSHKTRQEAEDALEEYCNTGEVSLCEIEGIYCHHVDPVLKSKRPWRVCLREA